MANEQTFRTERIMITVTPEEKEAIFSKAERLSMSVSGYCRFKALEVEKIKEEAK